jgi:hypothetical protein
MFVRTKKVQGREYRQLVENYREDGRHRQRVMVHLGKHETAEEALRAAREQWEALDTSKLHEQLQTARHEARGWERFLYDEYRLELLLLHDDKIPTVEEVKARAGEAEQAPYSVGQNH